MNVDDRKVLQMAGAEVMTWNVDRVERASSEVQGPLVVLREGETLGVFPYWCWPMIDGGRPPSTVEQAGDLYIYDPRRQRFVGYWRKLTWQEVVHRPEYRGIHFDRRGGALVR